MFMMLGIVVVVGVVFFRLVSAQIDQAWFPVSGFIVGDVSASGPEHLGPPLGTAP